MKRMEVKMKTTRLHFYLLVPVFLLLAFSSNNTGSSNKEQSWQAPKEAAKVHNPYKGNVNVAKAGMKIFAQQCAPCHGNSGKGDGIAAQFLETKVPNLKVKTTQVQKDGELFWKISNGKTPMPAFKDILSEDQRWQLVEFIRTINSSNKGGTK